MANAGNDHGQLAPMAQRAKNVLEVGSPSVVADADYYKEQDLAACLRAGADHPVCADPDTDSPLKA